MAKKILVLLLAVMLIFCITSCGKKDEYTVTLMVDGKEFGSFTASNKAVDLPTPEVPEEIKATHEFAYWYFINSSTGKNTAVDNKYFIGNPLKGNLTLHAQFVERLSVSYNKNAGGYYVDNLGVNGVIKTLNIPSEYTTAKGTYPIVGISNDAFKNEYALIEVVLPDTIKDIGNGAFAGCSSLQKLTAPSGITKFGKNVFGTVEKGNAVITMVEMIAPAQLFAQLEDKSELVVADINAGTDIVDECFKYATSLETLKIADGIETIGKAAFDHCTKLVKLEIPKSVKDIALNAFTYCESLATITVDAANTKYSSDGSNYILADSVDYVDEAGNVLEHENVLIAGCANTVISNSVRYIAEYAFRGAKNLTNVSIPSGVKHIDKMAFIDCYNIETINVKDGGRYASYNGNCIVDVVYDASGRNPVGEVILGCKNSDLSMIPSDVKVTAISEYAFRNRSELKKIYIPKDVVEIFDGSFAGCPVLEIVEIAATNSILTIGANAFEGCNKIKEISLPEQYAAYFVNIASGTLVTADITAGSEVGYERFKDCAALERVTLCDDITVIGDSAFKGCVKLSNVEIGSNLSEIKVNAFNGCAMLEELSSLDDESGKFDVQSSITKIGDGAFSGTAIKNLVVKNTLANIGYNVFGSCSKLVDVTIDPGVSVDHDAFIGSAKIATASLPAEAVRCLYSSRSNIVTLDVNSGTTIESYALRDAISLETLALSETVTMVDDRAFEGCRSLATITVDASNGVYNTNGDETDCLYVMEGGIYKVILGTVNFNSLNDYNNVVICSYAFSGSGIKELNVNAGWEIADYAFLKCTSLNTVSVNEEIDAGKIGDAAFDGCFSIAKATVPTSVVGKFTWPTLEALVIEGGGVIPAYAFKECVKLSSVVIDINVTSIGVGAFEGCTTLKTVILPNLEAVNSVDGSVVETLTLLSVTGEITNEFESFVKLRKLTLPSLEKGAYTVAENAFKKCESLTHANVPSDAIIAIDTSKIVELTLNSGDFDFDTIFGGAYSAYKFNFKKLDRLIVEGDIYINAEHFADAPELAKIHVQDSTIYTAIENCLVMNGDTLVLAAKVESVPAGVTTIGACAFMGRGIESINVGSDVTSIGERAFAKCIALKSCTVSGAAAIDSEAFEGCSYLDTVSLASGAVLSDNSVFDGCANIKSLSIPASAVDNINPNAALNSLTIVSGELETLWYAPGLKTLVIGSEVTKISTGLISGINTLENISVDEDNAKYRDENNCIIEKNDQILVLGCSTSEIPEGVVTIAANAFKGCKGIEKVYIPKTVAKILPGAFSGCSAIVEITVDSANTAYQCVNNCVITADGKTLVLGCATSIIPGFITEIASYAFDGSSIENVVIPASVTSIGVGAFKDCKKLTKVVFVQGSEISEFKDYVFSGCSRLSQLVIPVSVKLISNNTFKDSYSVRAYYGGTKADNEADYIKLMSGLTYKPSTVSYYSDMYIPGTWYYDNNDISVR